MDTRMLHADLAATAMAGTVSREPLRARVPRSFISKLHYNITRGLPHAEPIPGFRVDELELVRGVLQMLQGCSSSLFSWVEGEHGFRVKRNIYVSHLSQTSLGSILSRFLYSATCLMKVEFFVKKVRASRRRVPTMDAFASSVSLWLQRLRDVALNEEQSCVGSAEGRTFTLLGLTNDLSSLCYGAESLLQVVSGAIPSSHFDIEGSIPSCEIAVHILDYLFKKLHEICLVQGGKDEEYNMILAIFTGSVLPYLKGLDSWIYNGILADPYEELFFYSNAAVAIDQPAFWENSYLLRIWNDEELRCSVPKINSSMNSKSEVGYQEHTSLPLRGRNPFDKGSVVCPVFLMEIARGIISAGKSLQLLCHVNDVLGALSDRHYDHALSNLETLSIDGLHLNDLENIRNLDMQLKRENFVTDLSLVEVFLVSLSNLIKCNFSGEYNSVVLKMSECIQDNQRLSRESVGDSQDSVECENLFSKFFNDKMLNCEMPYRDESYGRCSMDVQKPSDLGGVAVEKTKTTLSDSFNPQNPVLTVCRQFLGKNILSWKDLSISTNLHLPPLNDSELRESVFGEVFVDSHRNSNLENKSVHTGAFGTDYAFGFQFGKSERLRMAVDDNTLEILYPFPTILPSLQDDFSVSAFLPFQKNSTLASEFLDWILNMKPKDMLLPAVIIQECLSAHIHKQVDFVGKHILGKLMSDWRLMDELNVLRAIYLLGSGDLLQQFLVAIFDKLDKGDSWDDDFELNAMLQESIGNSADGDLLASPESLVVSITKSNNCDEEEYQTSHPSGHRKTLNHCLGIDALDLLNFTYKVSWPVDLIANLEAINKYNQVMCFLLKVRRAKFALDKARRWMWKGKGKLEQIHKSHMLVEQKLLHFVDAFHQYVMDRVFHSAWLELCSGMASACSLDEVIEVHEAYLASVQRQCFVAPDKLWALIASRVKSILGLALDFYSIQQTLSSGGAAPAIKIRCEMEVNRIEKQFNDCIAFLLRILSFKLNVGHFPHLTDLVTRINYNYYYMSDSGNLLTVPGLETAALKTGRVSVSRAD